MVKFKQWYVNLFPQIILKNILVSTFVKITRDKLAEKYNKIIKDTNYDV